MADDYKALVDENKLLKEQVAALETVVLRAASQLSSERNESADLRRQLAKARKPARVLDPEAASPFDRPYDGR